MKKTSYKNTRRKILILLAALGLVTIAGMFYLLDVEHTRSHILLDRENTENSALLGNIIGIKSHSLLTFATDYTFWDEMVHFTLSGSRSWAAENIDASLKTYDCDLAWVFNKNSELIYFTSKEGSGFSDSAAVNSEIIRGAFKDSLFCSFFINTNSGLVEVSAASIHPTSDIDRKTEPRGYFVVGRIWTQEVIEEIEVLTSSKLRISDTTGINDVSSLELYDFISRGFYVFTSWDKSPIGILRSERKVEIFEVMHDNSENQFKVIILFISAVMLFTGISLYYLVNRPLATLAHAMQAGNTEHIKDLIGRKNEFGKMAELVNEFFIQREKLLIEINERTEAEFKARLSEEQLKRSLQEKVVLIKEVHHRVKNNLQVIISLLKLQCDSISDKATIHYLNASLNRIRSIAYVHELLYRSHDLSKIDFELYLNKIVQSLRSIYANDSVRIRIEIECRNVYLTVDKAVPCGVIINELISNSMKHAFNGRKEGCVKIKMSEENNICRLSISDDGIGFGTGMNMNGSKTLGLFLVSSLSDQLDAELNITNHVGSEFELIFKAEDSAASKLPLPTT